jgi:hypothetical protein
MDSISKLVEMLLIEASQVEEISTELAGLAKDLRAFAVRLHKLKDKLNTLPVGDEKK